MGDAAISSSSRMQRGVGLPVHRSAGGGGVLGAPGRVQAPIPPPSHRASVPLPSTHQTTILGPG